jgi:hypothetical protein
MSTLVAISEVGLRAGRWLGLMEARLTYHLSASNDENISTKEPKHTSTHSRTGSGKKKNTPKMATYKKTAI